jgi:hypothetical protein
VAELPDKTMIATLIMGSRYRTVLVWIGATAAFAVHATIAVAAGRCSSPAPPPVGRGGDRRAVRRRGRLPPLRAREDRGGGEGEEEAEEAPVGLRRRSAPAFLVIFVGEFGDLTQILTANLAAKYHQPASVFIGAFAALATVAALGLRVRRPGPAPGPAPVAVTTGAHASARPAVVLLAGFAVYTLVDDAATSPNRLTSPRCHRTFEAVDHYADSDLTPLQRAALAFTDAMIWTPGHMDPAAVEAMRATATPAQQVELVLDVTRNALNKIAVALGADAAHVDEGIEIYDVTPDGSLVYGLDPE